MISFSYLCRGFKKIRSLDVTKHWQIEQVFLIIFAVFFRQNSTMLHQENSLFLRLYFLNFIEELNCKNLSQFDYYVKESSIEKSIYLHIVRAIIFDSAERHEIKS